MREYQYLLETETHPASHFILWLTLLFILTAGMWAHYSTLDEVTRGNGKVIPSSQVQIVQNLEGGIIAEILIKEGDKVEPEQILLRIDDTHFASSYRESEVTIAALQAKIVRLTAESQGKRFELAATRKKKNYAEVLVNEYELAQSRQQELQSQVNVLTEQKSQKQLEIEELQSKQVQLQNAYSLVQKELNLTQPLVKKGVMSEVDLLKLQREASVLKVELETARLQIPRIKAAVMETERKIEELKVNFRTKALAELNDMKTELSRITESKPALEDRVRRTAVRSPVRGTVKRITMNTIGGVVQPGMDLVEIVPSDDTLLIEAQIRPADIAFLHPGQSAMTKFTAYDFSIFGGLKAQLEHISADTFTNERGEAFFLIRLRTQRNYLGSKEKPLPIIPGMMVNVDILTGKKSLLDYLLKPIRKAQENALRER